MNKYRIFTISASVIIILGTIYGFISLNKRPVFEFYTAAGGSVTQGVKVNGTVQAAQDLKLSFQSPGTIRSVVAKVGMQVKQGQVLASLDSKGSGAALDQASAALATAQANLQKVLNGATSAQVQVSQASVSAAQTALNNASSTYASVKSQQDTAVNNALSTLLNSTITATPQTGNPDTVAPVITGSYNSTEQGVYKITLYSSGTGLKFQTSGLENSSGNAQNAPVALGARGLFIQFNSNPSVSDTWTVYIPNTFASNYQTNYNAYQAALQTQNQSLTSAQAAVNSAQAALDQAKANLGLVQSAARPEDIAAAKAQVATALAAVESAQNNYINTLITAPIDGTITLVDAKVGQIAQAGAALIGLISDQKFQAVAYLSEADLGKIKTGDEADVTLSAYGAGEIFPANVIDISSAQAVAGNMPGYKITLEFKNEDDRLKSGMGAHLSIRDFTKDAGVLVPESAVLNDSGKTFVLKKQGGELTKTEVLTGVWGLGGLVEITSGISAGEQVAYFGK